MTNNTAAATALPVATGPVCGSCGNDGTKAALYVTIDAQFDPKARAWVLRARDDEGGQELDCLDCDARTAGPDFPYDTAIPHGSDAVEMAHPLPLDTMTAYRELANAVAVMLEHPNAADLEELRATVEKLERIDPRP